MGLGMTGTLPLFTILLLGCHHSSTFTGAAIMSVTQEQLMMSLQRLGFQYTDDYAYFCCIPIISTRFRPLHMLGQSTDAKSRI